MNALQPVPVKPPRRGEEEKVRSKLRRLGKRKLYVSTKVRILNRLKAKYMGYPKLQYLIDQDLQQVITRYCFIWQMMKFCWKYPNSYYVTLSTPTMRRYSDVMIKGLFIRILHELNRELFGDNKADWVIHGYVVVERHCKKGTSICPHIHAILWFPDGLVSEGKISDLFNELISTRFSIVRGRNGKRQLRKKCLVDNHGHQIFDQAYVSKVRQIDVEDLCQYNTKNIFHDDLTQNPSDEGAGLYSVTGASLKRLV